MKRKIVLSSTVFIITLIAFIWIMFPYDKIAVVAISKIQSTSKVKINYSQVSSGAFSTKISNLEVDDIPVGNVTLHYSPLTFISRSVSVDSVGTINGTAKLSEKHVEVDLDINPAIINSLTKEAEFSGKLALRGEGAPLDMSLTAHIDSDKVGINTPIGKLDFESVSTELTLEKNTLTIVQLTSKDDMALNLNGTIILNMRRPEISVSNIKGRVNVLGTQKNITLKGRLNNIKPSIR
ncbi:MAG: hypothetical protein C0603_04940 [Denitrovibrio sp.]|nr:MAG: hypothetical protein C0603_04940 [Denitrovibrio sp.]